MNAARFGTLCLTAVIAMSGTLRTQDQGPWWTGQRSTETVAVIATRLPTTVSSSPARQTPGMVKKRLEPDEAIFPDACSDPHPLQAVLQVQNSLAPTGQSTTELRDSVCCLLFAPVEVIVGCIRDSRLLTSVRCCAACSGGFTAFCLQALYADDVPHHTVAAVAGRD